MNTNVTSSNAALRLLTTFFLFLSLSGYSQPDYNFRNAQLLTAWNTDLKVGAIYKFPLVKTGIDARLTIMAMSAGVTLTELDGTSGYDEALQPTVAITAGKNGYVEFKIDFVVAGTTTPSVQSEVPATCIDVDGSAGVHEFDQINMGGGFVNFNTLGGELSIAQSGNWFTGTNISGIDYAGRDTLAKQVMFTVFNVNVSSITIRVGINNQSSSTASRLRSVYFKRFIYPNAALALSDVSARLRRERQISLQKDFKIYPSSIQSSAKLSVTAEHDGWAIFEMVDYSGHVIMQQQILVNKGHNNIPLFDLSKVNKGNYVAIMKVDGKKLNQKVIRL
jgi:hypothetical protein